MKARVLFATFILVPLLVPAVSAGTPQPAETRAYIDRA